jgi:hypothetical protein
MDITIISDSPLLEHDAMYMMQHYDKARQRLLEIRARDERRVKLANERGLTPEELELLEAEVAEARKNLDESPGAEKKQGKTPAKAAGGMLSFDDKADEDDVF